MKQSFHTLSGRDSHTDAMESMIVFALVLVKCQANTKLYHSHFTFETVSFVIFTHRSLFTHYYRKLYSKEPNQAAELTITFCHEEDVEKKN